MRGDPQLSPWFNEFADYLGRKVTIAVSFNASTRNLQTTVIHRDIGCLWTKVVFDVPSDGVKSKRLAAPADGAGDRTYTANQMSGQGLDTIEQAMAVQVTAEA